MIPHSRKLNTGGEDAYLATDFVLGVADGVGWWSRQGINAGELAQSLMREAYNYLEDQFNDMNCVPLDKLAEKAVAECRRIRGSSTLLFAGMHESTLRAWNLGDCGCVVVRGSRDGVSVVGKSEEVVHGMNFPFQIGHKSKDKLSAAVETVIPVKPGDLVVCGSDGFFDNVFEDDICAILNKEVFLAPGGPRLEYCGERYTAAPVFSIRRATNHLISKAHAASKDPRADTPFHEKCLEGGLYHEGGKEDDITVIVAQIGVDETKESGERTFVDFPCTPPLPYLGWP